jgi:hypothetical protein
MTLPTCLSHFSRPSLLQHMGSQRYCSIRGMVFNHLFPAWSPHSHVLFAFAFSPASLCSQKCTHFSPALDVFFLPLQIPPKWKDQRTCSPCQCSLKSPKCFFPDACSFVDEHYSCPLLSDDGFGSSLSFFPFCGNYASSVCGTHLNLMMTLTTPPPAPSASASSVSWTPNASDPSPPIVQVREIHTTIIKISS